VEGGVELTVVQHGNKVTDAVDRRSRLRRSNGEDGSADCDGWATGDGGVEVAWTMHPNVAYELNVGGLVFAKPRQSLRSHDQPWTNSRVGVPAPLSRRPARCRPER
jgi:hypothetical protein